MINVSDLSPRLRSVANWGVIILSILICLLMLPTRLPGTELFGIRPNWLLIWVVAWSVKRTVFQGAIAGLALGLIWDGMTASYPSHALSLTLVGILTARLQKQRYIQEDFISIALIVFGMTILAQTITALQYSFHGVRTLEEIWANHQQIIFPSALLSSLWAPVIYYPLNRWWQYLHRLEQSS
ncbi:rod shape-determining protein MreD [Lusitaniella coriacea]|uniref:rod shape-determining protein MreD n=1 Tax=Lusitaniella coriacea TaxID=1983105 RepID=UPI003CF78C7B